MGLFDFFSKKTGSEKAGKSDREMARFERLVSSKMTQNLDRREAIDTLGAMGTARAARILLKRFGWSMEPSITDQDEKEAAMAGIAAAGRDALEPIRDYCKKAESLTWPLRALEEIVPEGEVVEELLAVLDQFDTEYTRNSEPKVQLIALLEKYPCEDVRIAVEPFLGDVNESVRFTAVDTVFAIDDETSVEALLAALEDEESLRVKNRISRLMVERKWKVPADQREATAQALPPGFELDGDLIKEA